MTTLQLTDNQVQNLLNCLNEARKCEIYQTARLAIAFMDMITEEHQKAKVQSKPNGQAEASMLPPHERARLGIQAQRP